VQQNKDGQQKQYRLFGLFSLLSLLFVVSLSATSFEDFKRTQTSEYTTYRDKDDSQFSTYLKEQWQEYTAQSSKALYEKEKPKGITPKIQSKIKSIGPLVHIQIPKEINTTKTPMPKDNTKDVYISFFGQEIGFIVDSALKNTKFYPKNQTGIANAFNALAMSDYTETLRELKSTQKALNLNDWGIYQLVLKLSESLYEYPDERQLFSWFIFNKLGYDVKIALAKKHLVVMFYSQKIVYATPSFRFGDKKYYLLSEYAKSTSSKVYTYKHNYPHANKAFDLTLKTLPKLQEDRREKNLSFKEFGKTFTTKYIYNKNLIDFMATYPQADYEIYFNTPMSQEAYKQIATDIKKYVNAKHASVAINFVLHFVQKAFKYERDQQQFRREKVMFADETLYYEKSDCEDRAILFSYLIKHIFGISAIGVKYKDHMSVALYIPMKGDSVKMGKRRFVIADPTYINANIGQSMLKYKSKVPESFIVVKKGM